MVGIHRAGHGACDFEQQAYQPNFDSGIDPVRCAVLAQQATISEVGKLALEITKPIEDDKQRELRKTRLAA